MLISNFFVYNLNSSLAVGPNPVSGILTIQYPVNNVTVYFQLTDINGLLLKQAQFTGSYQFDMNGHSKGMYIIRVTNPMTGSSEERTVVKL